MFRYTECNSKDSSSYPASAEVDNSQGAATPVVVRTDLTAIVPDTVLHTGRNAHGEKGESVIPQCESRCYGVYGVAVSVLRGYGVSGLSGRHGHVIV